MTSILFHSLIDSPMEKWKIEVISPEFLVMYWWDLGITTKCGDIEQISLFFLTKIDYHNHMAPILQT